jgi:hypothetical protein
MGRVVKVSTSEYKGGSRNSSRQDSRSSGQGKENSSSTCGPGDDRPIGLRECYSLGGCWLNVDVVITREAIEKALSSSYQTGGFAPGVIEIHFADGGAGAGTAHFEGNYDLYLRVESVP